MDDKQLRLKALSGIRDSYMEDLKKKKYGRIKSLKDNISKGDYEKDYISDKVRIDNKMNEGKSDEELEAAAKKAREDRIKKHGTK